MKVILIVKIGFFLQKMIFSRLDCLQKYETGETFGSVKRKQILILYTDIYCLAFKFGVQEYLKKTNQVDFYCIFIPSILRLSNELPNCVIEIETYERNATNTSLSNLFYGVNVI